MSNETDDRGIGNRQINGTASIVARGIVAGRIGAIDNQPDTVLLEQRIYALLSKRFTENDIKGLADRKHELIVLFSSIVPQEAGTVLQHLHKKPLNGVFQTLSSELRSLLSGILAAKSEAFQIQQLAIAEKTRKTSKMLSDSNPLNNPRYLDNLFDNVSFLSLNGTFSFTWTEKGKLTEMVFPFNKVQQDGNAVYYELRNIYSSEASAIAAVRTYEKDVSGSKFFAYYKTTGNVIVPTLLTKESMPAFFTNTLPALRTQMVNDIRDASAMLRAVGNSINRIPMSELDEDGNLRLSVDPMTVAGLMHINLLREHQPFEISPTPRWTKEKITAAIKNGKSDSTWTLAEKRATLAYWNEMNKGSRLPTEAGKAFHEALGAAPYGADLDNLGFQIELKTTLLTDNEKIAEIANGASDQSTTYSAIFRKGSPELTKGRMVIIYCLRKVPPVKIVIF